ncbi:hypothetical protein HDU99_008540 [Rhizoclosmatium hyalinum]|nr:hypothetical protein HDU99_008540 [Rhizoclosmatium hyalinum]
MADQPPYFWSNLIAQTVFIPPSASRMDISVLASRNTMGNYAIFDSTASSTTVRVPASKNHAESVLKLPGWVRERAGEVWFEGAGTVYGDDDSIVSLILDVLVKLPLDLRTELAGNIVVTGEGSVVPGVMTRIETELRLVGGDTGFMVRSTTGGSRRGFLHRFDEVRRLVRDRVCVLRSCFQPNLVAWVGASVVGALKMGVSEVVKDDYLKAKEEGGGEAVVPDWSRLKMDEITKPKDEE